MPNILHDLKDAMRNSGRRHGNLPPLLDTYYKYPAKPNICLKKACKNPTEPLSRGRDYSFRPYCSEHSCQHWDRGQPCKNPTKKGEAHCEIHQQCDDPRCSNCPKTVGKKKSPWCVEHTCQSTDCKLPRYLKNANLNAKYCDTHTCIVGDCLEFSADGQTRCAAKHICLYATCSAAVDTSSDSAQAHPSDSYCEKHRRCRRSGCGRDVNILDNTVALKHCVDHYCKFEHQCDEPRADNGGGACKDHICRVLNCGGTISDLPNAQYCKDGDSPHECKTVDCAERRWHILNSDYCIYHICNDYNKHNCASQGDPQRGGFCEAHQRCADVSCEKLRFVDGDGTRQLKCKDHMQPCGATGCDKARYLGGRYCRNHTCTAHNDCPGVRHPGSIYCMGHKCSEKDCHSQRRSGSSGLSIQTLLAIDPTGASLGLSLGLRPYCEKHGCAHDDCDDKRHGDGKFCALHTCRSRGCANEAQDKSDYCAGHACQARNCTAEVVEDGHYCVKHTCEVKDCTAEAQGKGRYAARCRHHEDYSDSGSESSEDEWGAWPGWGGFGGGGHRSSRRSRGRSRRSGGGFPPSPYGLAW